MFLLLEKTQLSGYRLSIESPGVNSGIQIENNGGKDYAGKTIYKNLPDVGALENY